MKKFLLGAIVASLFAAVVALGASMAGLVPIAATSKEPALLSWFLHNTYKKAVAWNAADIQVPKDFANEQMVLKGAKNFAAMCAGCHTAPGKEATAASLGLNPTPPKAAELAEVLTAAERFWVINNGVKMTGMPAFGPAHQDKDELWSLVAFTEKLPSLNGKAYDAMVAKARAQMPDEDGHSHSHMEPVQQPKINTHHDSKAHDEPRQTSGEVGASQKTKSVKHDHSGHSH